MSGNSGDKSKLYGVLALGGVAVAGALYFLLKGREKDDDAAEFTSKPKAPRAATAAAADDSDLGGGGVRPAESSVFTQEYSFDRPDKEPSAASGKSASPAGGSHLPDADGLCHYPNLGVVIPVADGWSADEDVSPMPTVAMVSLKKAEYAGANQQMPGDVPVVLLSVEDIANEGLSGDEFREKSKKMALTQMLMMTNGMFAPEVKVDGELKVGPFSHCLEYEQNTPYFQMRVLNLVCLRAGFAYIFQLMGNPKVFGKVKNEVMAMARKMVIAPNESKEPFTKSSYVAARTASGAEVKFPPAWEVPKDKSAHDTVVLRARTPSTVKAEEVKVHNAEALAVTKGWTKVSEDAATGVATYSHGGSKKKVLSAGGVTLTCEPLQKEECVTADAVLQQILASAQGAAGAKANESATLTYVSHPLGLKFDVNAGSKVMESRFGERTVVYACHGVPKTPEEAQSMEESPILTIRVGDPSNDPDCRKTLKEWYQRIKEESAGEGNISELKMEKVHGRDAVTFISKDMQEVGPGRAEERTAKVIVFLKGETTSMLRWETPTENFRKSQRELDKVLASFSNDI